MNRLLITLTALLTALIAVAADISASREIEKTSDGYMVTYTLVDIHLSDDPLMPGFKVCSADGFNRNNIAGEPAYLLRNDTFIVPDGYTAVVESIDGTYTETDGKLHEASLMLSSTEDMAVEITPYSGYYPNEVSEVASFNKYRGVKLVNVEVRPVLYNLDAGKIRTYSSLSYNLRFVPDAENSENGSKPRISEEDNFLYNNTLNFSDYISSQKNGMRKVTPMEEEQSPVEYLIVTTTDLLPAAQKLAEWKMTLGLQAYVESRARWQLSDLKKTVSDFYEQHPSMYYLIIIGN